MKYCPNCRAELDDNASFCASCGTPAPAPAPTYQAETPTYQAPTYQAPPAQPVQSSGNSLLPAPEGAKGMAVASMVLGIVGLALGLILGVYGLIGVICCVVGLILSILALKKCPKGVDGHGVATAGLVCSIIGVALGLIVYLSCVACVAAFNNAVRSEYNDLYWYFN